MAVGAVVNNWRSYEPGIGEVGPWTDAGDANTQYHHADHLGTLRVRTASSGAADATRVFSAFGERLAGPSEPDRYGYVGAHGYQANEEFPFLHLGARYYDPGSGRFLQRDPIGIEGGQNVYLYTNNLPTSRFDPEGEAWGFVLRPFIKPAIKGAKYAWKGAKACGRWTKDKAQKARKWVKDKLDDSEPKPRPPYDPSDLPSEPPDFDWDVEAPGPDDIDPYDPIADGPGNPG